MTHLARRALSLSLSQTLTLALATIAIAAQAQPVLVASDGSIHLVVGYPARGSADRVAPLRSSPI